MRVTIAARGHYKPFAAVINDFGLIFVDKGLDARFVADINKFSVLNRECLDNFVVAFGSKNFSANNKVCYLFSIISFSFLSFAGVNPFAANHCT